MNFKIYTHLRRILYEKHQIENYQEIINEEFDWLEDDSIFENFSWAFFKSPINVTKMFGNQKKLTKNLISSVMLDIDLKRRKEAAGSIGDAAKAAKVREKADAAHSIKKTAITNNIKDIKQRITDLAGSDSQLTTLAANIKTVASLRANEKLIKAADGAQKEELKILIKNAKEKINGHEKLFKDYVSALSPEELEKGEREEAAAKLKDKGVKDKPDSTKSDSVSNEKQIEILRDKANDLKREAVKRSKEYEAAKFKVDPNSEKSKNEFENIRDKYDKQYQSDREQLKKYKDQIERLKVTK